MAKNKRERQNRALGRQIRGLVPQVLQAIRVAEERSTREWPGGHSPGWQKLEWAVTWLNERIDLPMLPEWLEEIVFRAAVSMIVEIAKTLWGDEKWYACLLSALCNRAPKPNIDG